MDEDTKKRKFLFNVDILIEDETNGRALEKLLQLLNANTVEDYHVKQGIELGKKIEVALKQAILKGKEPPAASGKAPDKDKSKERDQAAKWDKEAKETILPDAPAKSPTLQKTTIKTKEEAAMEDDPHRHVWEQLSELKQENKLIRLTVMKGKGIKLSIPCRILNTDPSTGNVTIYHVDEKKVYLFKINEIDDFHTG